jgi:ribosomal protein L13E
LIFLKKLGIVPRLYKKLVKEERVWSLAELKEEGLSLNQPQQIVIEESLI